MGSERVKTEFDEVGRVRDVLVFGEKVRAGKDLVEQGFEVLLHGLVGLVVVFLGV